MGLKKANIKRILKLTGTVALIAIAVVLLSFADRHRLSESCWKFDVSIDRADGYFFIDEDDVRKKVEAVIYNIEGRAMEDLNVDQIQSLVVEIPSVRSANVYKSVDGKLQIDVKQCQPLARIINKDGTGFYLDYDGGTIPLSDKFTAREIVVLGNIQESPETNYHGLKANKTLQNFSQLDEIYTLTQFIQSDEFWKAQIDHIYVNDEKDFVLVPRVGNHKVLLGTVDRMEIKFKKLKTFYKKTLDNLNLNEYKQIDLRFKKQVVCEKWAY